MSAELFVEPKTPAMSWEECTTRYPLGSIALDGFVRDGPRYDPNGPYVNLDHHVGVARLATLSTAQQVLMNTYMGMADAFRRNGEFTANVFTNGCDEDVCLSWYLLDHAERIAVSENRRLERLVEVAGKLDATGGAYPYSPSLQIIEKLAWIFEPYRQFRASGDMRNKDANQYTKVIQTVAGRIGHYVAGRGKSIPLDTRYEVIGGGNDWKMIKEIGAEGRIGAFRDNIQAYVIVREEVPGKRWCYTVGKWSEFIPFNILGIFKTMNIIEQCQEDQWGGNRNIGGSPQIGGSETPPHHFEEIINSLTSTPKVRTV